MVPIDKKTGKVNIQFIISKELKMEKSDIIEVDFVKLYIIGEYNDDMAKNNSDKGIIVEQENINQLLSYLGIDLNIETKNYNEILGMLEEKLTTYKNIQNLLESNNIEYRTCFIY